MHGLEVVVPRLLSLIVGDCTDEQVVIERSQLLPVLPKKGRVDRVLHLATSSPLDLLHHLHECDGLEVVILCLLGYAQGQVAYAYVFVGVYEHFRVFAVNLLLDVLQPFPQLERFEVLLRGTSQDGQVSQSLLKERVVFTHSNVL